MTTESTFGHSPEQKSQRSYDEQLEAHVSYLVKHIRFTLECDACGTVEIRDVSAEREIEGIHGWGSIMMPQSQYFCCPGCLNKVNTMLEGAKAP